MKKRIVNIAMASLFVAGIGLNFSQSINSTSNKNEISLTSIQEAQAVCAEYYGGTHVCCFYGGSGCANGVTDEYDGPYYYY